MRNLITDVPGVKVGHAEDLVSVPARPPSFSTSRRWPRSTCVAAGRARAKPRCSIRRRRSRASTPSRYRAARLSGSMPPPACRPGCASRAAALRSAPRACRSCRRRSCSICLSGGDKDWGRFPPYRDFGYAAAAGASAATSRSAASAPAPARRRSIARAASAPPRRKTPDGFTVGALAAVNAVGSVLVGGGPWFWAAPFEVDGEFGGRGLPATVPAAGARAAHQRRRARKTPRSSSWRPTPSLTKAQAKRLAVMAQSGLSRAIYPVHSPLDGDVVFAASTGRRPLADPIIGLTQLGTLAANVVARAIARGVFAATAPCRCPAPCRAGKINLAVNDLAVIAANFRADTRAAETTIASLVAALARFSLTRLAD